ANGCRERQTSRYARWPNCPGCSARDEIRPELRSHAWRNAVPWELTHDAPACTPCLPRKRSCGPRPRPEHHRRVVEGASLTHTQRVMQQVTLTKVDLIGY